MKIRVNHCFLYPHQPEEGWMEDRMSLFILYALAPMDCMNRRYDMSLKCWTDGLLLCTRPVLMYLGMNFIDRGHGEVSFIRKLTLGKKKSRGLKKVLHLKFIHHISPVTRILWSRSSLSFTFGVTHAGPDQETIKPYTYPQAGLITSTHWSGK